MGHIPTRKLIILVVLFLPVTFLIYTQPEQRAKTKSVQLSQAIANIEGWQPVGHIPLDSKVIESLRLDDYVFMDFTNGQNIISLYIGYYLTTEKIGAAHDPLVCFPGQGWKVSDTRQKVAVLKNHGHSTLQYATMAVQKNQQNQLILYWFQSSDTSSSNTFFQKLSAFKNRLQSKDGGNAFVRISISSSAIPIENAESIALDFIQAFYPVFIEYVQG